MNNLSNFGVQELDTSSLDKINGGLFGIDDAVALGIALVTVAATEVISDWEHFKEGLLGR